MSNDGLRPAERLAGELMRRNGACGRKQKVTRRELTDVATSILLEVDRLYAAQVAQQTADIGSAAADVLSGLAPLFDVATMRLGDAADDSQPALLGTVRAAFDEIRDGIRKAESLLRDAADDA